jgi:hypothetical protein
MTLEGNTEMYFIFILTKGKNTFLIKTYLFLF